MHQWERKVVSDMDCAKGILVVLVLNKITFSHFETSQINFTMKCMRQWEIIETSHLISL